MTTATADVIGVMAAAEVASVDGVGGSGAVGRAEVEVTPAAVEALRATTGSAAALATAPMGSQAAEGPADTNATPVLSSTAGTTGMAAVRTDTGVAVAGVGAVAATGVCDEDGGGARGVAFTVGAI